MRRKVLPELAAAASQAVAGAWAEAPGTLHLGAGAASAASLDSRDCAHDGEGAAVGVTEPGSGMEVEALLGELRESTAELSAQRLAWERDRRSDPPRLLPTAAPEPSIFSKLPSPLVVQLLPPARTTTATHLNQPDFQRDPTAVFPCMWRV